MSSRTCVNITVSSASDFCSDELRDPECAREWAGVLGDRNDAGRHGQRLVLQRLLEREQPNDWTRNESHVHLQLRRPLEVHHWLECLSALECHVLRYVVQCDLSASHLCHSVLSVQFSVHRERGVLMRSICRILSHIVYIASAVCEPEFGFDCFRQYRQCCEPPMCLRSHWFAHSHVQQLERYSWLMELRWQLHS